MQKYIVNCDAHIPHERRREINEKILYLINTHTAEESGITKGDVFNCYTGNGGLHGLDRKDYASFHEYTQAKKEKEFGQFFTPPKVCQFLVECIRPEEHDIIYDLTYGKGDFFNYLPVEENIYGTELDINAVKVARYLYPKANLEYGDIREYTPYVPADIVFGNPPFHLEWGTSENPISSQMYYCKKAYQILKPAGLLAVIVPESFLADPFTCGTDISMINQWFNLILQFDLPADTFRISGVETFRTKVVILQKRSCYVTTRPYQIGKTACGSSEEVYEKYIKPLLCEKRRNASKIYLEGKNLNLNSCEDRKFLERTTKLLFDIKRNKNLRHRAGRCEALLQKYYTQKQPPDMSWTEWQKTKIKQSDVLRYLKRTLSGANRRYENRICLVKTNYGFKRKDYREDGEEWLISSINDCILQQKKIPGYEKLLRRKRREYENQNRPFMEMEMDPEIEAYLENWTVTSEMSGEQIHLNPVQKREVNRFLQKRYGAIQFAMGTGKTLCMLAMAQYRLKYSNIRNVFVVGTALAINNTWEEVLQDYHIKYLRATGRKDVKEIRRGQIVLLTINQLTALKREMKHYVRRQSQKVMLVFDESDTISNPYSRRTKAMLAVFRKCRYKILATGTLTRNHVSEAAPQLELLYNNSINYLSLNPEIYRIKNGVLKKEPNFFYMRPFPAYRKGYQLFSHSHLPKRITVFGVEKENQDIYNAFYLSDLLDKTVITRSFEEVAGRKIYRIHQITCSFSETEKQIYQKALDKFEDIRRNYFAKLDNPRKDAMFRILQQLLLLLRVCADPSLMFEYTSEDAPIKLLRLIQMIQMWEKERVAVGVRHIEVVRSYQKYLREAFPDRPLFILTGKVACKKRKKVIDMLEKTENGILLSTQQSLSESMNIDFVDRVVLPELYYNNAAMAQYYFRFIRYTSTHFKNVYFLTYEKSIEMNLLKMVISKEKINLFMKKQEAGDEELYEYFNVDPQMLQVMMIMESDQEGRLCVTWGEQKIS